MRLDSARSTPGGDGGFAINTWRLPFYQGATIRRTFLSFSVFGHARCLLLLELSRVAARDWVGSGVTLWLSRSDSSSRRLLLFQRTGSRVHGLSSFGSRLQSAGSAVSPHGFSCSAARGIFPDGGSNWYLLHWPVDSSPLSHQGSPVH